MNITELLEYVKRIVPSDQVDRVYKHCLELYNNEGWYGVRRFFAIVEMQELRKTIRM